VLVFDHEID
jgi:glutamine cyclotransferase